MRGLAVDALRQRGAAVAVRRGNRGMLGEHGRARGDAADIMLVEVARGEMYLSAFARLGHRGNYHVWSARGGEYEYPGSRGKFDDEQHLVRYAVRHQAVHAAFSWSWDRRRATASTEGSEDRCRSFRGWKTGTRTS